MSQVQTVRVDGKHHEAVETRQRSTEATEIKQGEMTMPESATPDVGDMYGQGGAVAIYWPDTHPCGPERARAGKPWLVLTQDGGVQYAPELRDDGPPAPWLGRVFLSSAHANPLQVPRSPDADTGGGE